MKNAAIVLCPRCGERECTHDERLLADALAKIGTGVTNMDVCANLRWMSSMRRYSRTAIVELKREGERMRRGQDTALKDLTGKLEAVTGYSFEQRSFLVRRTAHGIAVSTPAKPDGDEWPPTLRWRTMTVRDTWPEIAAVVRYWLHDGKLFWDYSASDEAA